LGYRVCTSPNVQVGVATCLSYCEEHESSKARLLGKCAYLDYMYCSGVESLITVAASHFVTSTVGVVPTCCCYPLTAHTSSYFSCRLPGLLLLLRCCSDSTSKEGAEVAELMRQELEPLHAEMQVRPAGC
jgi:hypothetical protein